MADIRIKDLPTTATQTSSDDFIALDGTTNGTRKLSAYNPSFGGAITGVSLTAPTTTNLTLAGGSTGASLVLGQGVNGAATLTAKLNGDINLNSSGSGFVKATSLIASYRDLTDTDQLVGHLAAVGLTNTNKATVIGYNTTSNYGFIYSGIVGSNWSPLSLQPRGGNVLIGTTTDSGNGKLQLATHTTSAGGIGFGTDTGLYRAAQSVLAIDGLSTGYAKLRFYESSVLKVQLESVGGDFTLATLTAGKSLKFHSGNDTLALTLASNQAATFAGAVTTGVKFAVSAYASNSFLTGNGSGFLDNYYNGGSGFDTLSLGVNYDRRNNAISSAIVATGDLRFEQGTGGQSNFVIALGGTNTVPTDRFTIASTGAATFAGAVTAGAVTASGPGTIGGVFNGAGSGSTNNVSIGTSGGGALFLQGYNAAFNAGQTLGINTVAGGAVNVGNSATITTINGTTPSTGAGSGALQVAGGIYSGAASVFGGDVTRTGSGDSIIKSVTTGTTSHAKFNTVANVAQATWRTEGSATSGTLFSTSRASATQIYSESGPLVLGAFGAYSAVIGTNNVARLTIDSTGAATFGGAVAINNTVAAAAGVASTHKVTMVIGGVTYYLLASNV